LSSVAPLYVSEILEPQNSRRLTVFEACGTVFGLVTGFLVGLWALASCLRKDWSWGFIFLPTPLFIAFWLILVALVWPHSPHWLALKGRENEEGRRTVARLRSRQVDEQEVVGEWIDTKVEVRYQRRLLGLDHMDLGPNHIRKTFKLQFAGWRRLVWVVCQKRTAKAAALTVCQQVMWPPVAYGIHAPGISRIVLML
jgi:MFS family permease